MASVCWVRHGLFVCCCCCCCLDDRMSDFVVYLRVCARGCACFQNNVPGKIVDILVKCLLIHWGNVPVVKP